MSMTTCSILHADQIVNTLVTDLAPDAGVLAAMNNIETKRRERVAATEAAEAQKIIIVKTAQGEGEAKVAKAEGEREAMKLQGEGVALQRKAIVDGLKDSVVQFVSVVHALLVPPVHHTLRHAIRTRG